MKSKIITTLSLLTTFFVVACGGGGNKPASKNTQNEQPGEVKTNASSYDPKRGEGKFNEKNVTFGSLNATMAEKGNSIAGTKCFSCHRITDEKLVGPGWKGVTQKRSLHWIMNFITNPDPMIDKDPELQAQLEICLIRMPNQNLTEDEAKAIIEFMRKNDGAK